MPHARRVDNNHQEIAQALRQAGLLVLDVHTLAGMLDLLVVRAGTVHFLEVKQPHARNRLTPAEVRTIAALRAVGCSVHVVTTVDEALAVVGLRGQA